MEEQVKDILAEWGYGSFTHEIDFDVVVDMLKEFGKQQWNAACDRCDETAEVDHTELYNPKVLRSSILKNKLP